MSHTDNSIVTAHVHLLAKHAHNVAIHYWQEGLYVDVSVIDKFDMKWQRPVGNNVVTIHTSATLES